MRNEQHNKTQMITRFSDFWPRDTLRRQPTTHHPPLLKGGGGVASNFGGLGGKQTPYHRVQKSRARGRCHARVRDVARGLERS